MSELDRMIEETLNEEDRAFLARVEREPGYFSQVGGLLSGPSAWVNLLLMVRAGRYVLCRRLVRVGVLPDD